MAEHEDFDIDLKGIKFGWHLLAKWSWTILAVILGGHMWLTHQASMALTAEQQKQNMRLDRIERAITACLDRQIDCEVNHPWPTRR